MMLKSKSSVLDGTAIREEGKDLSRHYPIMGTSEELDAWEKVAREYNARWLAAGGEVFLSLRLR